MNPDERRKALIDADILVGTRLLLHDVSETGPSDCWGLVVASNLDELLAHPGFRVAEDAWRAVRILQNVATASGTSAYLQTTDPDNLKIRRLLQNPADFMREEAEHRRQSGYPPHGELITVTVKADTVEQADSQASELRRQVEREVAGIALAGPLRHSRPYRDGKWRSIIVIKTDTVPPKLTDLLRSLSEEYIIDRNPETVG
jgi:primosomal protein N'